MSAESKEYIDDVVVACNLQSTCTNIPTGALLMGKNVGLPEISDVNEEEKLRRNTEDIMETSDCEGALDQSFYVGGFYLNC